MGKSTSLGGKKKILGDVASETVVGAGHRGRATTTTKHGRKTGKAKRLASRKKFPPYREKEATENWLGLGKNKAATSFTRRPAAIVKKPVQRCLVTEAGLLPYPPRVSLVSNKTVRERPVHTCDAISVAWRQKLVETKRQKSRRFVASENGPEVSRDDDKARAKKTALSNTSSRSLRPAGHGKKQQRRATTNQGMRERTARAGERKRKKKYRRYCSRTQPAQRGKATSLLRPKFRHFPAD